jgi:hypothetical protein
MIFLSIFMLSTRKRESEFVIPNQEARLRQPDKLSSTFCLFCISQFWAAYVPCEAQYKDAVQITLEQIDVIERLTDRYSPQMTKCSSVYGN